MRVSLSMLAEAGATDDVGSGDPRMDQECYGCISDINLIVGQYQHDLSLFEERDRLVQSALAD